MVTERDEARFAQEAKRANLEIKRVTAFHNGDRERYRELCEKLGHDPGEGLAISGGMGALEVEAADSGIICLREEKAAKALHESMGLPGMDLRNYPLDVAATLKAHRLDVPGGRKEMVVYAKALIERYGPEAPKED